MHPFFILPKNETLHENFTWKEVSAFFLILFQNHYQLSKVLFLRVIVCAMKGMKCWTNLVLLHD